MLRKEYSFVWIVPQKFAHSENKQYLCSGFWLVRVLQACITLTLRNAELNSFFSILLTPGQADHPLQF